MAQFDPLTHEQADAIYDVLVKTVGAPERQRGHFVHAQTNAYVSEWRFQGALGFGGKFWRNSGRRRDESWGELWYVNCYQEDETAATRRLISRANTMLADLIPQDVTS